MSNTEFKDRILHLQEALRKLSELKEISLDSVREDYRNRDTILYNLQITIEALTDIGNYILKRAKQQIPRTRVGVFESLCRSGILEGIDEDKLKAMARFRNKLVHGYQDLELKIIYDILQNRYDFLRTIAVQLIEKFDEFDKS